MLTLFTIPKAFDAHTGIIQENAIKSWLQLKPAVQVILLGNDPGTAEFAARFDILHLPDVERSASGTPLISSMFMLAQSAAENPLVCYINADIILLGDFIPAIRSINLNPMLMVGQRWDLDVTELIGFNDDWESLLRERVRIEGKLHGISGIDYFVFQKGLFGEIPPFAVGRTYWDDWLVFRARQHGAAIIDATAAVTIIHQNHDYGHDSGGAANVWKGPEAVKNKQLAGNGAQTLTLEHANYRLTGRGLKGTWRPRDIYFKLDAMARLHSSLHFLRWPLDAVMKAKHTFIR